MKISLGNDHGGFPLKDEFISILKSLGVETIDYGSYTPDPVDFPDIARKVGDSVRRREADQGIMVCSTGVGAAIGANKILGIRAAIFHDIHCAHQGVEHDNVNIRGLGANHRPLACSIFNYCFH